jgi:regulator of cell morphogenesis and NO signaling
MRDLMRRLGPREQRDGDVARIGRLLSSLVESLGPHMRREERELFPLVEELVLHPDRIRAGSISRRLLNEFVEHGMAHERLQKIRCAVLRLRVQGYRDTRLLDDIDAFDRMTHRHIHYENNVLAPRVMEIENQLRVQRAQLAQLPL